VVRDTQPHLARIFSAARGIIFLGTPHRGSGLSSLAKVAASVAQVALQTVNDTLIRDLERDSQTLDRIRDSFSRSLARRAFTIWSFVEELSTPGVGKVYSSTPK
jgi:protein SERAC1